MTTSPQQLQQLHRALISAFTYDDLYWILDKLGVRLNLLVRPGGPFSTAVFELIQLADRAGWTNDLVRAAYEARPDNPGLAEAYQLLNLGAKVELSATATPLSVRPEGESSGKPEVAFAQDVVAKSHLDLGVWRSSLVEAQPRVCRVEVGGGVFGTGFLVGPDIVLTCRYVVEDVIKRKRKSGDVRCRFDFHPSLQGVVVRTKRTGWLVAKSDLDDLDYVLLRLERAVDEDLSPHRTKRGWFSLPTSSVDVAPGTSVQLLHYGTGGALRLTVDTDGVIGLSEDARRLQYRVKTEPGSGGAPLFDSQWQLLAIHESAKAEGNAPKEGEGVLVSAIRDDLSKKGLLELLGPRLNDAVAKTSDSAENYERPPTPPPIVTEDDPQKSRWGGLTEVSGRRLIASVPHAYPSYFVADFSVVSTDGTPLQGPVVFHLHDTFSPSVIYIRKIRGGVKAVLEEVTSHGVFTVAAQVRDAKGRWISLELDLSGLASLPKRFLSR
jgi:hypothetical protein